MTAHFDGILPFNVQILSKAGTIRLQHCTPCDNCTHHTVRINENADLSIFYRPVEKSL